MEKSLKHLCLYNVSDILSVLPGKVQAVQKGFLLKGAILFVEVLISEQHAGKEA
jgi:hypothetical protein